MTNLNNIIEILAKQAMGGQQQSNQQSGLGGILGSVLGQLGAGGTGQTQQGGLGDILGSVLGGGDWWAVAAGAKLAELAIRRR